MAPVNRTRRTDRLPVGWATVNQPSHAGSVLRHLPRRRPARAAGRLVRGACARLPPGPDQRGAARSTSASTSMRTTSSLRGVWQDAPALGSGAIPVATYSQLRQDDQHRSWAPPGAHGQRRDRQSDAPAPGPAASPDDRGPAGRGRAGCAAGGPHGVGRIDLRTVRLRAGRLPAQPGRSTPARGSRCGGRRTTARSSCWSRWTRGPR